MLHKNLSIQQFFAVYSWKLSKSREGLSEAANNAINELISKNIDLHEPYYRTTGQDHAACFYYPVFDQAPLSIELPGPCNESITGVPNFNLNNVSCFKFLNIFFGSSPLSTSLLFEFTFNHLNTMDLKGLSHTLANLY